jgi:hypothetical protein
MTARIARARVAKILLGSCALLFVASSASGQDPYAGRPLGQCNGSADCAAGQICSNAPGGICTCSDDSDCGPDLGCSAFSVCVGDCSVDDDCAPGFSCRPNGTCGILTCSEGTCPVPLYACSDLGLCERAACSPGTCPDHTTCSGGRCIEDRQIGNAVPLAEHLWLLPAALLTAGFVAFSRRRT